MSNIYEIANKIKLNGGNIYLVGGAIRDNLLGIENHDEDYCVTGISFDEFKKLFPEAVIRGKDFPVFSIDNKEFAIARKERKIGIGHNNFDVETDKNITIEEDLERRDITINAIAKEVLTNKIIDPEGGIKDLKNKIIRAVSNHFAEDPLRVYRAIYDLIGAEQPVQYHPEGDSYNHTMIVLDKVANQTKTLCDERKLELRFAALVHDLGKGATPREEYPHHINHEKRGVELVKNMGKRLKIPTRMIKCGITSCLEHMRGGIFDKMTPPKKVSFIERVNNTILGLDGLQIIVDADNMLEDSNKNQFANLGHEVINCTNGNKIMKQYGIFEGREIANRIHETRVMYLKNRK